MTDNLAITKKSHEISDAVVFLHGELDIRIIEAKSLPNMDLASERMRKCFTMLAACGVPFERKGKMHSIITSDPYASVCLSGATVAKTRVISNSEDPFWDEHFRVFVAHPVLKVEFQVKDNDVLGAQLIGVVEISADKILSGNLINGWFPILGAYEETSPELHLSIQYIPVGDGNSCINKPGENARVANTYFPLHKGGNLTLYQDAHVPDDMLPEIGLDGGKVFKQNKCWEDICHAILEAHHLIYIVGWSVFHKVRLVRESSKPLPSGGELCLGDLLKYKSQEGVRVVLLIWDDKTSHDKFLLKTEGLMQTHDEETKKFFRHSSVRCVLCPRYASNKLSIFKQQVVGTIFSHHQKCVLLDTQATGNNRKITAFIGGLDLCNGRYDTPEHRLFNDLNTVFKDDYRNPTLMPSTGGPRQPWHDQHCKIEGPAAYDIMTNFEQRWRKATKWLNVERIKRVKSWNDDTLIKLDRISWILTPSAGPDGESVARVTDENDVESWNIQVFRSIDSGSVRGFPKDVKKAEAQNLVCRKNLQIDRSIHTAYVKAIRSAQHFVYIENQYFLGSSYCWPSYKNAGADNLVPMELALKVASKIAANERFSVYIVIPMYPEGAPASAAMQEILFWQGQTMTMMYKIIGDALAKAGLSDIYHPQDYLNFYCLGKRECLQTQKTSKSCLSSENGAAGLAQKFRRFMIYVHSKGMIVDDEYIMIGSANINQRSLDGSRDTEIAMGAYQPKYTWAEKDKHPRGQVYGYRMSLWAEHLGHIKDTFQEPQTLVCVRQVNKMAKRNWKAYVSEENNNMTGHLMRYPIQVSRSGKVGPLPGYESFPDVGGKVLGAPSSVPDALTT